LAINSEPLSERINSGAPCLLMASFNQCNHIGGLQGPVRPQHMALAGVLIEQRKHPQGPAPDGGVSDEVLGPDMPAVSGLGRPASASRRMRIWSSVVCFLPFMVWVLDLTQTNTEGGSIIRGQFNMLNTNEIMPITLCVCGAFMESGANPFPVLSSGAKKGREGNSRSEDCGTS